MERSWIMLSDYLPALFAGERPGLLDDHLVPFFGGVLFVVRLEFPGHLVVLQILGVFLERSHGNHAGLRHLVGNHGSHEPALVVLRLFDLGHVLFGCASLPWFRKVRIRAIFLRISRNSAISLTLPAARSNFKPRSFSRSSRSIFRSSASGLFFISWICCFFMLAGDHLGLHGQFERGQAQRFLGDPLVGGFHFEDYPAGTHHEHVMVHAAFAAAHGRFRRPLGDGLVREHADPKASLPFDVVRDGPPGGFDLPRVQSRALERLQAVLAVIQVQPAGFHGPLAGPSLVPLAMFYLLGNKHGSLSAGFPRLWDGKPLLYISRSSRPPCRSWCRRWPGRSRCPRAGFGAAEGRTSWSRGGRSPLRPAARRPRSWRPSPPGSA